MSLEAGPHFRAHPLDGALLYFDRRTGLNVRIENEQTRHLRRVAPRVVMFGITNACNLRCDFCSRDLERSSRWTVESAASILEDLARAGTLEVAFGGGEPFAFRGFGELVARLRRTTSLAIHVTTNGTLLGDANLSRDLDMVRLSIYADWRRAAQRLAGRPWGANVLVDDHNLSGLPTLLNELAALGAMDVSLLSYVGADERRQLSLDLGPVVKAAPLPCRLSVCFGDRLGGMHAIRGGDCGAGLDFVTLTSDRRLQSCSFQDVSHPIESAEDVLSIWRRRDLDAPSPRLGCRRASPPRDLGGVRIWQGFSGNNSGECVLVAHFDEVKDADELLADLLPGYEAGQPYSATWRELFERERVTCPPPADACMPDEMHAIGRTFVARTDSAPGDDFPELRALAWKRGARVQPGGIHEHHVPTVLYVVKARTAREAQALAAPAKAIAHGRHVIGTMGRDLDEASKMLKELERPFVFELFAGPSGPKELTDAVKRTGRLPPSKPRLLTAFWTNADAATSFAAESKSAVTGKLVLVEGLTRRKRLALRALGYGGRAHALESEEVAIDAWFRPPTPPAVKGRRHQRAVLDRDAALRALRIPFPRVTVLPKTVDDLLVVEVHTREPVAALASLDALGRELGLGVSLWVRDLDPLDRAIARLLRDLP